MPVLLHVHSWYSLLEAVPSPQGLLQRAEACSYPALALTDTNNFYGAVSFADLAWQHGVRPLLGARLQQHRSRCVALIAEPAGYASLCRILSRLHLTTTRLADLLVENAAGLQLLVDDLVLAEQVREAFGKRLWLEVVRPARVAPSEAELLTGGRRLGLDPVASVAAHLATPEDYPAFRLVSGVSRLTLLDQLPARLAIGPEHHLLDPAAFAHRFRDLPEAVRNTDVLAEQLQSHVLPHQVILPRPARLPRGQEEGNYLRLLCERGLRRRGLGDSLKARERLREELAVIEAGQLSSYFLVVRDIARYARGKRYSMALRGSAGNSLVCYLLEITDVNPLRFQLPLERFLHPGRADLPDIDLDFDWKVRDEVIAHVFRRHGPEHAAMVSSHLFFQPRSAFREAGKLHGLSTEQVSELLETLSDRVEGLLENDATPGDKRTPPRFPLEPERWPRILHDARLLLGRPHHLSIHPGGVILTPQPIENHAPLQRAAKGIIITQFDKDAVERVGLVKIDLLGNRALGTVDAALGSLPEPEAGWHALSLRRAWLPPHLSKTQGVPPDLTQRVPPDGGSLLRTTDRGLRTEEDLDEKTISLLQRGDTLGVNQLESPAMRHLLIQMRPRSIDDVIQALAMIRPGAASVGMKECFIRRRRGLEPVRYPHPCLAELLGDTQGLMLYEDDALRVLEALTGLPAANADHFRKRVARHRTEAEAQVLTEEYLAACANNGVPRAVAAEIWVQLAKFNHYSFCKSHAVSYGLIAGRAAWLKTHHTLPFWTGALNNNQGMYPRRVYIEAIKRAGIPLRLPCANHSQEEFSVEEGTIRAGFGAIASLNEEFRMHLLADRQRHGPFRDLADLRRRLQPGPEALALLIRSGALDFTGQPRPALFLEADLQSALPDIAQRLFADDPNPGWSPEEYALERRLRDEWDLLGFVVGPPLMALFRRRLPPGLVSSRDLPACTGRRVRLAGLVATARHTPTTDGRDMQFVTLEDEWGLIEVTLFPGTCTPIAYLTLGPYLVTGVVEEQYGVVTVTAHRFEKALV
jgi:DNA-directed DNA polymerase III PolC